MITALDYTEADKARGYTGSGPGADRGVRAVAALISTDPDQITATVSLYGSPPLTLPMVAGQYHRVNTVYVLLDNGKPVLVAGPAALPAPLPAPTPAPAPPAPKTVTVTKTVTPTWTGSWITSGRWNQGRMERSVFQGRYSRWGPYQGVAVYGQQVTALGATAITAATLTVVGQGGGTYMFTPVIQAVREGTRPGGAPSLIGQRHVHGRVSNKATHRVSLPASIREALRTGAARGLALVGPDYGRTGGTDTPAGMALTLTYEKQQ